MGTGERIKGKAQEIGGRIKAGAGAVSGKRDVDRSTGVSRERSAAAGHQVEGMGEKIRGRVKSTVGAATGDRSLEARGKAEELKGRVRSKLNK
jgi:uncharacterized protein YjbJ (UPF0337 family)